MSRPRSSPKLQNFNSKRDQQFPPSLYSIAASIHDEYDFGVSQDRNRTVVYLEFIYTRKIDKRYAKIASDRIHREYSSG